ncbi:hypothetical protein B0H14DRAFT_3449834 [Mycena olivaceomarginata]|nr:hypothetical protein B0H14DRAFT_3449834 [Mycena olivaceomarginata]
MTTIRTFQNEIDEYSREAVAKQRAVQAQTVAEKEKENKKPPPSKGKAKEDAPGSPIAAASAPSDLAELEDKILAALLSNTPDLARDLLASLLTQNLGEYVFRIGLHPPHAKLFAGELTDDSEGWTGVSRTEQELDVIHKGIRATVEEVGGKTSVLFETRTGHPRLSLLLRLPPPNVSLTPEVRCAVVGNVDSGKSTTLGVLTRGALDDGRGRARVGLFRHKHEIETGRTSSVGMEILGFSPNGAPILPNTANSTDPDVIRHEKLGWEEISIQAAKIAVEFEVDVDVAGAAAGGDVADDEEAAEMARKREWAEWLEKVVAHPMPVYPAEVIGGEDVRV